MTIRVEMVPHLNDIQPLPTNGISAVVKNYFKYLPQYDIELVETGSEHVDLVAVHAGSTNTLPVTVPVVSHNHGLYWTSDHPNMGIWTHEMNGTVIDIARRADAITVPSRWVAEVFRRDMHLDPDVIGHGVEWEEWQEGVGDGGYVLWNKNRASDACDPTPVNELAMRAPKLRFLSTYTAPNPRPNIKVTGTVDFATMRQMVLNCSVYLATTKETFGIGTLEAMAAGKPILGFNYGGTADLVTHAHSGYLAEPGNYSDLVQGLLYCLEHREALGENARKAARHYTWESVAERVAQRYALALERDKQRQNTVAVVIPCYNKASTIVRTVRSVLAQTHKPDCIYVVNNNSTDDFGDQAELAHKEADAAGVSIWITNCPDQGVAHTRNFGISLGHEDYICCLDADDEMHPDFLEKCRRELIWDRRVGIAYTGMEVVHPDGRVATSQWPGEYDFDGVLKGRNQVPTCCLFRREAWKRAGGFRQRYAPTGAGSEDADFWLRIGLLGYDGKMVTAAPLFRYHLGGIVSGNSEYREKDWRNDKGYLVTEQYPFAATFTPANGLSHPVRQYDQPEVSVIIPVSRKHLDLVWDAIDSVESQTFRKWELIVVGDGHTREDTDKHKRLEQAFPFIKFQTTYQGYSGAGAARNLGVELAKSPLLLFLDADDWLVPTALEEMMEVHRDNPQSIIYTDYYGHAFIQAGDLLARLRAAQRLIDYNPKTSEAKVLYEGFEYDCLRAQSQPIVHQDPYIWNVISSLVPRAYHIEIGGFDVTMQSWEDWDYWVRMAKAGKCFEHLSKPLLEYRFYTGERRSLANPGESGDRGRQLSSELLEYMRTKYGEIENMPCSSCGGGNRNRPSPMPVTPLTVNEGRITTMSASDMVMVELIDGNHGDHLVAFAGTSYGYQVHGNRFRMLRDHARLDRRVRIIDDVVTMVAGAQPMPPPPPNGVTQKVVTGEIRSTEREIIAPDAFVERKMGENDAETTRNLLQGLVRRTDIQQGEKATKDIPPIATPSPPAYDFMRVWGVKTEERVALLHSRGIRTLDGLIMYGGKNVAELFGIPEMVGRRIISEADKLKEADMKPSGGRARKK